jgi:hypothetical protein
MKTRAQNAALFLCLALPILAGCGRHIVRAASPSVATPPPNPRPAATPSAVASEEPIAPPEISEPAPELSPSAAVGPQPPRPRPAPVATEPEAPRKAEVAAPQISPVLTPADQDRLTRVATDQIRTAEHNLQLAAGRRMNALQKDLQDKVQGFLSQAHEAIRVNDWVRAQNLAEKAQVLSSELLKSF